MNIELFNSVTGAGFIEAMVAEWRAAGDRVDCHGAVSDTAYRLATGRRARWALRWKMYARYPWAAWRHARRDGDADVRIVTTNPFFAPALLARTARSAPRPVATVNLIYDLFPEAAVLAGTVRAGSRLARWGAECTRRALQEADLTVFLGERLRLAAEQAYGPARRAAVVAVGADARPFAAHPPRPVASGQPVSILYAGLMGRMHETATLRACWSSRPVDAGVTWRFHASGGGYQQLRAAAGQVPGVEWAGPLGGQAWAAAMRAAPVALVTMAPGAERVVMPSKTYSALVAGQAVLAICPPQSDLADLVRRHECGWVVAPGNVAALAAAVAQLATDPGELQRRRERAFAAGHENYSARVVAATWRDLLAGLGSRAPVRTREAYDEAVA